MSAPNPMNWLNKKKPNTLVSVAVSVAVLHLSSD